VRSSLSCADPNRSTQFARLNAHSGISSAQDLRVVALAGDVFCRSAAVSVTDIDVSIDHTYAPMKQDKLPSNLKVVNVPLTEEDLALYTKLKENNPKISHRQLHSVIIRWMAGECGLAPKQMKPTPVLKKDWGSAVRSSHPELTRLQCCSERCFTERGLLRCPNTGKSNPDHE
jgi:hypothetical protein